MDLSHNRFSLDFFWGGGAMERIELSASNGSKNRWSNLSDNTPTKIIKRGLYIAGCHVAKEADNEHYPYNPPSLKRFYKHITDYLKS